MSHRFFVPEEKITDKHVKLTGSDVSHIRTVLRLKAGASIQVINGLGQLLTVRLVKVKVKEIQGEIIASEKFNVESPLAIHLGLALTKGSKFDTTLRASVELGVSSVTSLSTDRCVIKKNLTKTKTERWKKIVLESSKQCGRAKVPLVTDDIESLEVFCRHNNDRDIKLVFWENESNNSLKNIKFDQVPCSVAVLIGPEGGFSLDEINIVRDYGFQAVRMGPRIIRAETAPVVVLALLQSFWGDL
jgi:16S rRNA (uracil1498-N3)-methyltransferase